MTLPLGDLTSHAGARGRRPGAPLHRRHAAHHGRAEPAVPLGQRGRPAVSSTTSSSSSASASPAPTPSPTSPRAPAPTPASSASRRRAGWRASSARGSPLVEDKLGPAAQGPAHQVQRLLQRLRPAPRRRHRLSRREPQRQRPPRAALPARGRRAVDTKTPAPTAWRSAPSRRRTCPKRSSRLTDALRAGRSTTARPSRSSSSASARKQVRSA